VLDYNNTGILFCQHFFAEKKKKYLFPEVALDFLLFSRWPSKTFLQPL